MDLISILYSLLKVLAIFGMLIAAYFLNKNIIKPFMLMKFYKSQGIPSEFIPIHGTFKKDYENVEKHGEFYYNWIQLARERPRPKAFAHNVGSKMRLVILEPEILKEFFTNHENYIKDPELISLFKTVMGNGLVFAEGSKWKKHRKILSSAFHYDFLKDIIPSLVKICEEFLDKLQGKDMSKVQIAQAFTEITGEIVGRVFFGEEFSEYYIDGVPITHYLQELIDNLDHEIGTAFFSLFGKKFIDMGLLARHRELKRAIRTFRNFSRSIVQSRRAGFFNEVEQKKENGGTISANKKLNLIEILLQHQYDNHDDFLTDDDIVDEFATFFTAGLDSTAYFLAMATYYIMKHKDCKDKLMNEVQQYFGDKDSVDIEKLNKMDYMSAVLKESLRLGTPSTEGFERVALKDHNLGGLKVKKGTLLIPGWICNNYDPDFYPEPEKFDPERFMVPSANHPFTFTPFSIGARNCIGQHLALNEAKIIFSLFLQKYDYENSNKDYQLRFTLRYHHGPDEELSYKLTTKK